eukprot:14337325-Alexandrium_andersonii.AAC.1
MRVRCASFKCQIDWRPSRHPPQRLRCCGRLAATSALDAESCDQAVPEHVCGKRCARAPVSYTHLRAHETSAHL